mmetsp:Transcript_112005/g.176932  ORF Transcript_112005/g.176932 Transcript_112005/m.176932 type:complete len:952 (-) Transcript_112005:57-2912(-)
MAAEVRAKVLQLYQHSDPAVKKAADDALQEFQKSDLAWQVSQELLRDADLSVQFFGAQMLYNKVQLLAKGYQQADEAHLNAVVRVLQENIVSQALSQPSRQRLVLALAASAVHLCVSTWQSAVEDLLLLATAQPQSGWCAVLAIPEQLSSVVHSYTKTDRRTLKLLESTSSILNASLLCAPACGDDQALPSGTLGDSPFSLAMQALTQWSKTMGMSLIAHEGFAVRLVEMLNGPVASSDAVLDLVLEVLKSSPGAFMIYEGGKKPAPALERVLAAIITRMQTLLPSVQELAGQSAICLEGGDARRVSRWAKVAATLVEAYTQVLWIDSGASNILISFLGACFVVHPHIAQSIFELWSILKDAGRDGKLPPGVLSGLIQKLAAPCIESFTRFGRWDSPYAEERAELVQLREAQQDILCDLYCISAGTPEEQLVLSLLQQKIESAEAARDWHGLEVVLYGFAGIAEALANEPGIPEVYALALQAAFRMEAVSEDHCTTIAMLLRTCGPHFERGLKPQLVSAVQWLVGMVQRIPEVASEAVQELCGYAGEHLLPHVSEFLKVVVDTSPRVSAEVDASLHGALVGIIRCLDREGAVAAFLQICEGTTVALAEGLDVVQETGREKLHRCLCRLLRCSLVMREGKAGPESSAGQPSESAKTAATSLTRVLSLQWTSLAPPCQKLLCSAPVGKDAPKAKPIYEYSDAAVQVNILALLRNAAQASKESVAGGPELCARIVELAAVCCGQGQLACLMAVSIVAANPDYARACILPSLDGVCQASLSHIQAGRNEHELIPFLELTAALSTSVGEDLFRSPQVPMLRQLCLLAVQSAERDILKPAMIFLLKLMMSRTEWAAGQSAKEVVEGVLSNFHKWPRSLAEQTFKLFSSLLERCETLFLELASSQAVPCMTVLPPAEQAIAQHAFRTLRGPRFKAFLGDLGAIARGDSSMDMLHVYAA